MNFIKKRFGRDKFFIATKFGVTPDSSGISGKPEYVKSACRDSLERLGNEQQQKK
jgi:aryl-alcohol dehydrogenase-like predicted oxidoreductase